MSAILSSAGGIYYHLKALRYRTLWGDFQESLNQWLCAGDLPPEIFIFGASGGYCLTETFLKQFERITLNDIDPLSPLFFRNRFKNLNCTWDKHNHLLDISRGEGKEFLKKHGGSLFLFCNILGQKIIGIDNKKHFLMEQFSDLNFISFHDIYSSSLSFKLPDHEILEGIDFSVPADAKKYLGPSFMRKVEITDHLTKDLFPNLPKKYMQWQISKKRFHLIEGVKAFVGRQ